MRKGKTITAIIILFFLIICGCGLIYAGTFIAVDDENYASEVSDFTGPLLVFFYADWCPFSETLIPRYADIEEKYAGKIKFCRYPLDIGYKDFQSPEGLKLWDGLAQKYGVETIPTIIMFNQGKEIDRMRGRPETELLDAYRVFFTEWIESNLINPEANPYRFNGGLILQKKEIK